jgi:hypothetical protein
MRLCQIHPEYFQWHRQGGGGGDKISLKLTAVRLDCGHNYLLELLDEQLKFCESVCRYGSKKTGFSVDFYLLNTCTLLS